MGRSLGANAATLTANGDPKRRFAAAVAMDSFAKLQHGVRPRVPTIFLQSQQELLSGPRLAPPPPTALHATRADYAGAVRRKVPTAFAVLAGSTHHAFAYLGPEAHLPASSLGQRVAAYYALAWLDRWLKDDPTATQRVFADRFDRSVDVSSMGLGTWDPATRTNRPYLICGLATRNALSRYYVSRASVDAAAAPICEAQRGVAETGSSATVVSLTGPGCRCTRPRAGRLRCSGRTRPGGTAR